MPENRTSEMGKAAPVRRARGRPRDPAVLQRILAAAREHFGELGFDRGNIDRIAVAAEVSKVTLYKYFPSKEALFNAIVNEPIQRVFEPNALALDPALPETELLRLAETYLALITSRELLEHVRMLHAAAGTQPALGKAFLDSGPEALVELLVGYLERVRAGGTLEVANAPQAAEQFLAMVRGNEQIRMLLGQAPLRQRAARRRYCKSCVDLFVRAFRP